MSIATSDLSWSADSIQHRDVSGTASSLVPSLRPSPLSLGEREQEGWTTQKAVSTGSLRNNLRSAARRGRSRSAFTLIELLLVLVILAVLATIVVVNFGSVNAKKNEAKAKTDIQALEQALELYKSDVNDYPTSQDGGLAALVTAPGNSSTWKGPYIKRGLPQDPWGHSYVYVYPGNHNQGSFDLSSAGDGKPDTATLDNWSVVQPK